MKFLVLGFLVNALICMVRVHAPTPRRTQLVTGHSDLKKTAKRKLFLDDLSGNFSDPTGFSNKDADRANLMKTHNRRNAQLREVSSWFGDVDFTIDKFRDQISQKLDQLNNRLQTDNEMQAGIGAGAAPLANGYNSQILSNPLTNRPRTNPFDSRMNSGSQFANQSSHPSNLSSSNRPTRSLKKIYRA